MAPRPTRCRRCCVPKARSAKAHDAAAIRSRAKMCGECSFARSLFALLLLLLLLLLLQLLTETDPSQALHKTRR